MIAKPFIKWVGGKTQLLDVISEKYPKSIKKYCEPFVGGGAVLFDVLNNYTPENVLINDINPDLINTYKAVKEDCDKLIDVLEGLQTDYYSTPKELKQDFYLEQRDLYNSIKLGNAVDYQKAALFIFLNKTCFNGLYRVNSKGGFNVPWNKSEKPLICDKENLMACSELLQNVEIHCGSYSDCESFMDSDTFAYFDPPYRPITDSSSFTAYDKSGFNDNDQKSLAEFIKSVSQKGSKVLASNSDPKNSKPDDDFFDKIYEPLTINRVMASRMINSNGSKRGPITEILVSNF